MRVIRVIKGSSCATQKSCASHLVPTCRDPQRRMQLSALLEVEHGEVFDAKERVPRGNSAAVGQLHRVHLEAGAALLCNRETKSQPFESVRGHGGCRTPMTLVRGQRGGRTAT
jgi:hypothetical protein